MPIWKCTDADSPYKMAIWKIEEPLDFFSSGLFIDPAIQHPRRQLEFACGRFLLQYLVPGFPVHMIQADSQAKPRISGLDLEFSISHSYPYVAALINPGRRDCGIDIQVWHPRIQRLKHKFLNPEEVSLTGTTDRNLIAAWTAKEAAYKYLGQKGLSLIESLPIKSFVEKENHFEARIGFAEISRQELITLKGFYSEDFAISYTD